MEGLHIQQLLLLGLAILLSVCLTQSKETEEKCHEWGFTSSLMCSSCSTMAEFVADSGSSLALILATTI
jgi:hypothetical protein